MAQSSDSKSATYVLFKRFLTKRIGPEEEVLPGDTGEEIFMRIKSRILYNLFEKVI